MRHLILTRGVPGAGKSTWINQNGLRPYTIEPDAIRLMIQSPVYQVDGSQTITQRNDGEVWNLVFHMLESRMKRGELVVIDATHSRNTLINRYRKLAREYRYRVHIVDFSDVSVETALLQNKNRNHYKFVPEIAIRTINERLKSDKVPSWVQTHKPDEFSSFLQQEQTLDFSDYEKIVVFGDIHGCLEPLKTYFSKHPFNENYKYIFVGDYFDRGIQNADTFTYLYDLMQHDNTLFLTGNHEKHLVKYVNNGYSYENIKVPKPSKATFDEFTSAGIETRSLKDFAHRLGQYAFFTYHDKTFVITHGGISTLPTIFHPTDDFIHGIGKYQDSEDVDKAFCENTPDNVYQIHGHRNVYNVDIENTERTFNLNGDQEFGGYFRLMEITPDSFNTMKISNNIYDKTNKQTLPTSVMPTPEMVGNLLEYFHNVKDVNVKELGNDIHAVNFSNKVFYNRTWNQINTKARGLFLHSDGSVVARSYDKFFNWREREETKTEALMQNLMFPVTVYEKSNGFLGILSVHNNEWFVASKSTNQGDFAEMFRDALDDRLTDDLKQLIITQNISLVFEVIHPNDPHICDYHGMKDVILLDIIKNDPVFTKWCDHNDLIRQGTQFRFHVKTLHHIFETFQELYEWRKKQDTKNVLIHDIEGYVLEDATGFQWKYKGAYYNFWKRMRSFKDRILKHGDSPEVRKNLHSYEDFKVYNHMITIPVDKLTDMSIIDVYNHFKKGISNEQES